MPDFSRASGVGSADSCVLARALSKSSESVTLCTPFFTDSQPLSSGISNSMMMNRRMAPPWANGIDAGF
jgi:hypothetical protein